MGSRDPEFVRLFVQEAEDRLHSLGEGLLSLEAAGPTEEAISSIFREAHNLKGAAAVVGVHTMAEVAHAMEDVLDQLRRGTRPPTAELFDALLQATDGLRAMLDSVLEGNDSEEVAERLVSALRDVAERPADAAATSAATAPAATAPRPRRDVVRIPTERLQQMARLAGEATTAQLRLGRSLGEDLGANPADVAEFRDLGLVLAELQERSMQAQMLPISTITDPLRRAVRDLARQLGKQVRWEVKGEDTELDRTILEQLGDPVLHLVRNAVDHGIEPPAERAAAGKPTEGFVRLHALQLGPEVVLAVTDDGRGIRIEALKAQAARVGIDVAGMSEEEALDLAFRPGLSTASSPSDVSGRGVGLDAVRAGIEEVRGRIEVRSEPGAGTEFRISIPITLSLLPCLIVAAGGGRFAIPTQSVLKILPPHSAAHRADGRRFLMIGQVAVPVAGLAATLGLSSAEQDGPIVVLSGLSRQHAFVVDGLVGQRDVVLRSLGRLVPRMPELSGASVEPDGSIVLVLDPHGLVDRPGRRPRPGAAAGSQDEGPEAAADAPPPDKAADILVVDDALTVRELQRSILQRAGYRVRTVGDGLQALAALSERPADLVLTDIEMPNMDGFALTESIRANPALSHLPVIILTTQSGDDHRRRGLEAGADRYLVKSAFDSATLLEAVERLLGSRAA